MVCRCHERLGIWFNSLLSATQKSGRKVAHSVQVLTSVFSHFYFIIVIVIMIAVIFDTPDSKVLRLEYRY